jgi:hypothetical protein
VPGFNRKPSVEVGEELAAVEVRPLPFVCLVVDREFDPTLRTGEPGPLRVAHSHVDPTPLGGKLDPVHLPR